MKKIYRLLLLFVLILFILSCSGQNDEEIKKVIERIENVSGKTDEQKYTDLYVTGVLWENKDVRTAEKYYLEAAKYKKSSYADIGRMYYRKVNKKKGIEKYKEGWKNGDSESANELGIIYDRYEKKPEEAEKWWKLAGEQGNASAQFSLGLMYEEKGEISNSIKWYKKSAEQDNIKAQYNLALLFKEKNMLKEAEYWYGKAAESGDTDSQNGLGIIYEKRQNYIEAEKWYKKSSEGGNKNGKYNLAYLYETIFKDFEKAKILYLELDDKNSMERIENMERVK
ncbi:Predicted methyltransferase (contains TPR repeat) [Sebaldella termitidis]|uniref:Sel1 domain protein repeat-containing protein n=1 Tax=Sebaldella termitidis (strain ATCC 33386 / NCTC 11300) TaxID=526218 RepID=D1AH51_SEBTE|nr:tetratricopeptide repeat protein [Sebaldella termitidis]ACZ08085.1 Sel1 domain protein repeat-containing protein [Sebaldella termitidis ATCC 33386]SUI23386.1 Predicted methyltransferase (contains TPR repeat) [Sebaldella termitidis]